MAIMATESATSSKKLASPQSHESRAPTVAGEEHDATKTRPGEVGKESNARHPEREHLDDDLEDPYDNVACTD